MAVFVNKLKYKDILFAIYTKTDKCRSIHTNVFSRHTFLTHHSDSKKILAVNNRHFSISGARKTEDNFNVTKTTQLFTFDTHESIKALERAGFSQEQAEGIKNILVDTMLANYDHMNKRMVSKQHQEIFEKQMLSHISSVRKDMIILEKSEFSMLKHEYEKQNIEIKQIKQNLSDELAKLNSGVQLSLNLEKARTTEAHQSNKNEVASLNNKVDIQSTTTEGRFAKLDGKMDREVATLIATFERHKNESLRYAIATIASFLGLSFAGYRLMKS